MVWVIMRRWGYPQNAGVLVVLVVLGKDNCKTRRETFKFGDLMRLILEILRYICMLSLKVLSSIINTLRPRQNGRHFPDDNLKWIFLDENVLISIRISLKFVPKGPINNIPALVQIMAWHRPAGIGSTPKMGWKIEWLVSDVVVQPYMIVVTCMKSISHN